MTDRIHTRIEGDIAFVELTRPDKHNGMDMLMLDELVKAQKQIKKNKHIRVVILSGQGPSFCAGLDVKSVMSSPVKALGLYLKLWSPRRNVFQDWSMGWRDVGVPVIAVVHGNCFGAGIQLALGADIRFAHPEAKFSLMEAKWGLVPDMGGPTLLRELLPLDVAKELVFTGRVLPAKEAKEYGLVTHVSSDPMNAALALADEIRTRSPDSVAAGKYLLQQAWFGSSNQALGEERRWQRAVMGKKNQRISVSNQQSSSEKPRQPYDNRSIFSA